VQAAPPARSFRLSLFALPNACHKPENAAPARRDRGRPAGPPRSAQHEAWLGEAEGIDLTLTFLRQKRQETKRLARVAPVELGMPRLGR